MSLELEDVISSLKANEPFDSLSDGQLAKIAANIQIIYARKDERVQEIGQINEYLSFVRKGAVDIRTQTGDLFLRIGEGECFGFFSLLTGGKAAHNTYAIEDSLIYRIPAEQFHALRSEHTAFSHFFSQEHEERLSTALTRSNINRGTVELMTHTVNNLIRKEPIFIDKTDSIERAAQVMAEHEVSSLLVRFDEEHYGIVTDRDLRTKVLATGKSPSETIGGIATSEPLHAEINTIVFEALHLLMRKGIHHLPVEKNGAPVGMITMTDIMRLQSANSVFLLNEIYQANTATAVAEASKKLPRFITTLVDADATAKHIGHAVTGISEAITVRLIELAIDALGPPPAKFCWLAFGSQARNEQTAYSDQDNGIVIEDGAREKHDQYFKALAKRVCDGLNDCGFIYCPGKVMATNDRWRQEYSVWQEYFSNWVKMPEPEALLHASIFFDMRTIYGDESLQQGLSAHVAEIVPKNTIFQSAMAANASRTTAPLGFFRNFVLENSGEHKDHLDIKHNAMALVVDIGRNYALSLGISAANTDARIDQCRQLNGLSMERATNVRDAYEFIGSVRLKHQISQIKNSEKPNNYINPKTLSSFERRHLKDAFKIINEALNGMAQHFNAVR